MPTVESAWETYVKQKCSEATEKALEIYDQIMEPLSSRLPCDNEDILTSHREAQGKSIEAFEKETAELISAMIEKVRGQLTVRIFVQLPRAVRDNLCFVLLFILHCQYTGGGGGGGGVTLLFSF